MRRKLVFILVCYVMLGVNSGCSGCSSNSGGKRQTTLPNEKEVPEPEAEPGSESKKAAVAVMKKVADWQMGVFSYSESGNLHDSGINSWTNGTLYTGLFEWAKISDNPSAYFDWLRSIGDSAGWEIASNFVNNPKYSLYHADELCMGNFYLKMYDEFGEDKMYYSAKNRVDWIMSRPPEPSMAYTNKQSWTWCDALFMAPSVYAHISKIENDVKYLEFMDREFRKTYAHLYDPAEKLFFRDDSYFDKKEANGKKIFWGRGNGWVAAGIVSLLKLLPADSEYRPFYEQLFKEFVPSLVNYQNKVTGFWHASLLDPDSYPSPETSATALITYAIIYGVNSGLLSRSTYMPVIGQAWEALQTAVHPDGKLGWVQPIGADPKTVTKDMTAVYGVGAFLLAGTEYYKLEGI